MSMGGRSFTSVTGYRYGFNGQESDFEIFNSQSTSYTAEFWQYDSRLGRRWNVDPIVKPFFSPYSTFANNPNYFTDPQGNSEWHPETGAEGTTTLVADAGDNTETLKDYSTKNNLNLTDEELSNFGTQIDQCSGESCGDIQGLALSSDKFDNIPGKNLMNSYNQNPENDIYPGDREWVCSPTTFLRADKALDLAYENQDLLGDKRSDQYKAWNSWNAEYLSKSPELIGPSKTFAVGVLTYLNVGTKVTATQAVHGALKPGAILNLTYDMGRGGHSAVFHSYIFDKAGNITGFYYWQAHDGDGAPSGSYLGVGNFDKKLGGYTFGVGVNFK
jgi:hypothetical protein